MKETVKTFVITTLILLVVVLSVTSMKCYQKTQEKPEPKTITVTDTLTQVIYDTVFVEHFETVKLPVVDTLILINDSIRIDSVFVEVPISIYKFDTTFCNDTTRLDLFIQNKGFNVTLDSLYYRLEYTPTKTKTNYFKEHFKFGAGVSTGFGVFSKKPDVFIGGGFYYCF